MQSLFNQFSQVLGTTLLHSLWQALVIYALLRLLFLCVPSASATNKYNMALLALAASVLWPLITLLVEISRHPFATTTANNGNDIASFTYLSIIHTYNPEVSNTLSIAIDNYLPYLVVLWFIGIALNSARLLWGWRNVFVIKQNIINAPVLQFSIQKIAHLLKITKQVQVFMSEFVDVPCIIGYLQPMIILPVGLTTQFSAEQIQSILIHEMAHIRRSDYLINLLQQIVGILFFFNPFTHLINKIIYNEREHCCDDLVLQITGQPLIYAQTLLKLEEKRSTEYQLALAATGKKHHLLNRIKRIMETKKQVSNIRHVIAAVLLLLGSMGTIAWLNPEIKDGKISISPAKAIPFTLPYYTDTLKKASAKATKPIAKHKSASAKTSPAKPKGNAAKTRVDYNFGYDNPVLDKLSADVQKQGDALQKIYESPEYLKLQKEVEVKSNALDSFYNQPELKQMQEELDAKSDALNKMNDNPEIKAMQDKLDKLSKTVSEYYESAEFKKLQKNFDDLGKWFEQENASKSPDFKKRSEELEKAGEALRNYTKNPQYTADKEQARAYWQQVYNYRKSPDFKQKADEIKQLSKNLAKAYDNPQLKQQQKELNVLSKQLREYNNRAEVKKIKEQLNLASAHLREYTNSPAYKKLQEELRKNRTPRDMSGSTFQSDTTHKDGK